MCLQICNSLYSRKPRVHVHCNQLWCSHSSHRCSRMGRQFLFLPILVLKKLTPYLMYIVCNHDLCTWSCGSENTTCTPCYSTVSKSLTVINMGQQGVGPWLGPSRARRRGSHLWLASLRPSWWTTLLQSTLFATFCVPSLVSDVVSSMQVKFLEFCSTVHAATPISECNEWQLEQTIRWRTFFVSTSEIARLKLVISCVRCPICLMYVSWSVLIIINHRECTFLWQI